MGGAKNTLQEFKEFASKGNVMDMAIGVIIGGAFGKIVTSFVNDVIMPIISVFTGGIDFNNLFYATDGNTYATAEAALEAGVSVIKYGTFISSIIDFIIIAIVIFIMIKQVVKLKRPDPKPIPEEPKTKTCPYCKSEINIEAVRCPNCTSELSGNLK